MTNLEKIKTMTAEQMTEFICGLANRKTGTIVPYDSTIEWLESEAENDK